MAEIFNGVTGFMIFKEAKSFWIKVSTALIGSFLFLTGLSMTISGDVTDNLQMQKGLYMQPRFWGYIFGFLLITGAGAWI